MGTERDTIGGIKRGDIGQFELLFRTTYKSLVNYAISILKDRDTAEEIVQDLFYRLWRDRKTINIKSSLNGYLFRSVYNKSMHYLEHQKVVRKHASEAKRDKAINTEDPIEIMKYNELHERIAEIIGKLPERCARIFCMSRFEGLKYAEIAEELSISIKTVESNMGRALKEFRNGLL